MPASALQSACAQRPSETDFQTAFSFWQTGFGYNRARFFKPAKGRPLWRKMQTTSAGSIWK
ncbi:hypothetical protein [Kingella potus]|uniref:hypothetical protein n=1 Tax=Kingella potus TaxID=265175 RepID=UPI001FD3256C|nr:hypothetical protein [Kingella potus]UOP00054.1 hypothetical protein LVJ84_08610 [Kingella potus]